MQDILLEKGEFSVRIYFVVLQQNWKKSAAYPPIWGKRMKKIDNFV